MLHMYLSSVWSCCVIDDNGGWTKYQLAVAKSVYYTVGTV